MTYPPVPPGTPGWPERYPLPPDALSVGGYPPPPPGHSPPASGYHPLSGAIPPGYHPAALPSAAYTSWITRVAASVIDGAVYAVIVAVGAFPYAFTGTRTCVRESTDTSVRVGCEIVPSTLGKVLLLVAVLAALVFQVWNYGYRQGTTGSSIGKSVMKYKVVGEASGRPIGVGRSLLRQIAHLIDGLTCYIGYLFPLWDAKRQTIADKIMSTVCLPV